MPAKSKFVRLAAAITEARTRADMTQVALARNLGIKQQSVSRWEAGTHRPATGQIDALADALKIDRTELAQLARGEAGPVVFFAPLLPLGMLPPEIFERFTADLAAHLYPVRNVRMQGGRGHDQEGWDVLISGEGETIGLQCKQVTRFGPSEVERAIKAVDREVDRKVLVLSRVVSPKAAEAAIAAGWDVWDQDDISRKVRQLSGDRQDELIDNYFRGQRLALLGRDEPGPWVETKRFFAPFDRIGNALTHQWALVGRDDELKRLAQILEGNERIALVVGAGGSGKSRLIKAAITDFSAKHPATRVRFLSPTGEPDHRHLAALGSEAKLLVVDDAHDRDGLPLLIEYAADERNNARLLISTRTYARQRIHNDLSRFGIFKPCEIVLGILGKEKMRPLVINALQEFEGDASWDDMVLRIAGDNPLVAIMAARVMSQHVLPPELVRSAEDMRKVVIESFAQVLTMSIGDPTDRRLLRDMLGLIALLQPVPIDDRQVGELLTAVTPHAATEATRALRLLIDGGILYKRGRQYRLMPDVLGDYLIDDLCIQTDGKLSIFAELVIKAVDDRLLPQLMVNLGRLDWRRNDGDPTSSKLIEAAWARFDDIDHEWDPRVEAIRKVAIYQPSQALRFVSDRLRRGKGMREASPILRNIAYTERYRNEAITLLWELGRDDAREIGQHTNHPIRVLAELCEITETKPREFSQEILDFAFSLMDDDQAWTFAHTPLEIVAPVLKGTIDQSRSTGRSFLLSHAFVRYDFAQPLRQAVIDRIIALLEHPLPHVSAAAAKYLQNALQMPYGMGSSCPPADLSAQYQHEFAQTIDRATALIKCGALTASSMLAIAMAVSWHAEYGGDEPSNAAQRLLDELPTDLGFRLRAAMVDRSLFTRIGRSDNADFKGNVDIWLPRLATEISQSWPAADTLLDQVEIALAEVREARLNDEVAFLLVHTLLRKNLPLARGLMGRAMTDHHSVFRSFAGAAAREILELEPGEGQELLAAFLGADQDMASRTITALCTMDRPQEKQDLILLQHAVTSETGSVAQAALSALHWARHLPNVTLKGLILQSPFDQHPALLSEVAMLIMDRRHGLSDLLTPTDVEVLLERMQHIKQFADHWTEELLGMLAECFPRLFADFLFARTDQVLDDDENDVMLLGYRFHEGKLGFHKAPEASAILDRAWTWLRQYDDAAGHQVYRAAELVAGMFDVDAEVVVEFLDSMLDRAAPIELKWMGKLLRHAHHRFPFRQRRFVESYLDRCAAVGHDILDDAILGLSTVATTGMRTGTVGEPTRRDLQARDEAKGILASLPRLSPAYSLYEAILRDAENEIARSIRDGEALDTEEQEG